MGVAFTTMATLLLELAMTRIFSVVFYYHFAFLAISIALFGLGAGGVFSYVIAAQPAPLFRKLGRLSLINAVMPLISVIFIPFPCCRHCHWRCCCMCRRSCRSHLPLRHPGR